jgi:hypothetical protein
MFSDRERKELERKQKMKEIERRRMKKFLEDEAELGSDDEENDDVRKRINREDDEEQDGDELDADLEGFVVRGDEEEINDADDDMIKRHRELMDE